MRYVLLFLAGAALALMVSCVEPPQFELPSDDAPVEEVDVENPRVPGQPVPPEEKSPFGAAPPGLEAPAQPDTVFPGATPPAAPPAVVPDAPKAEALSPSASACSPRLIVNGKEIASRFNHSGARLRFPISRAKEYVIEVFPCEDIKGHELVVTGYDSEASPSLCSATLTLLDAKGSYRDLQDNQGERVRGCVDQFRLNAFRGKSTFVYESSAGIRVWLAWEGGGGGRALLARTR